VKVRSAGISGAQAVIVHSELGGREKRWSGARVPARRAALASPFLAPAFALGGSESTRTTLRGWRRWKRTPDTVVAFSRSRTLSFFVLTDGREARRAGTICRTRRSSFPHVRLRLAIAARVVRAGWSRRCGVRPYRCKPQTPFQRTTHLLINRPLIRPVPKGTHALIQSRSASTRRTVLAQVQRGGARK